MEYFEPAFQENYSNSSLYFGTVNESNANSTIPWFESQWKPMLPDRSYCEDDFFYIGEDPEFIEKASSVKLWIYATADGEDLKNSSHKITVNNKSSCTILFDPIDTFGYSYGWKSFNITLDWLIAETNTISVVDAYTSKQINDLIIGIDTENDYDRSQWKESSGSLPPAEECEGELMMVLQFIF